MRLNLLPPGLQWCIAGGYAACPALAGDIDVWVFGIPFDDLENLRAAIADHIRTNVQPWFEASTEERTSASYSQDRITILKVGEVDGLGNKGIHVMVTNAESPASILDGFDVSTHAVAIMPNGSVVQHPLWTPPNEPPVALLDNSNTPERMARIGTRFGHKAA